MKAALLTLLALLKPPFVRLLSSMKFQTFLLGVITTQAAKHGFEVDETTYWTLVGFFGLLLGAQAATDAGKEAAKARAAEPGQEIRIEVEEPNRQSGRARLDVLLVLLLIGMVACGASARERTLRATFVTATTAQAGFVAWDLEHQRSLLMRASSREELDAAIAEYRKQREPVIQAFTAVYRVIAATALLEEQSVAGALSATKELQRALRELTGRSWP